MMTATATKEPDFEVRQHDSLGLRIQHVLHGNPVLGPLAVLVLAIVAFAVEARVQPVDVRALRPQFLVVPLI